MLDTFEIQENTVFSNHSFCHKSTNEYLMYFDTNEYSYKILSNVCTLKYEPNKWRLMRLKNLSKNLKTKIILTEK